jgi:hypothetical protein
MQVEKEKVKWKTTLKTENGLGRRAETGASFTKLTCIFDISFGNFLLW